MADKYVYKFSRQYLPKWLRYDIKHVKNRHTLSDVVIQSHWLTLDDSCILEVALSEISGLLLSS